MVNAYKHAFSQQGEDVLRISLHQQDGTVKLSVSDNGPGLPEDFEMSSSDSLGTMLIDTFATQLGAKTEINSGEGTEYVFRFSQNGN
ncbi:MAG: sensor histidine kinase [Fodinibius sp.]|nr:sensor histidine kinase [Fodinibius sp.]